MPPNGSTEEDTLEAVNPYSSEEVESSPLAAEVPSDSALEHDTAAGVEGITPEGLFDES